MDAKGEGETVEGCLQVDPRARDTAASHVCFFLSQWNQDKEQAERHLRSSMDGTQGRESRAALLDFLCTFLPGPHRC